MHKCLISGIPCSKPPAYLAPPTLDMFHLTPLFLGTQEGGGRSSYSGMTVPTSGLLVTIHDKL